MQSQPRSLSQMPPDLHEWAQRPAGWKCSRKCSTFAAQRAAGSSRRRARSESSASSWCAQHTLRQRVRVLHADYSTAGTCTTMQTGHGNPAGSAPGR